MVTTIVNTPPTQRSDGNGMGFVVGIIILILFGLLFFFYALPYLRQMTNQGIQVNVPAEITVPSDINVTVENPE